MRILERLIGVISPHECLGCGQEGSLLCATCMMDVAPSIPSRCYLCRKLTADYRVCSNCRSQSALRHVWVRTEYEEIPKRLIHYMKFMRAQTAAEPIAQLMSEALPYLDRTVIIMPVPTASSRIRQRGYDQASLIARYLSGNMGLPSYRLLARLGQSRQLGATRAERQRQLLDAFRLIRPHVVQGASILLVDDVVTTGATLEMAARVLRQAGAKHVDAIVFAQRS